VRRILLTLIAARFVVQNPATQHYGLGGAIRALSASVVEHFDLRATAGPVLAEIAAELHTTMFISVYRDGSGGLLDRIHDIHGMEGALVGGRRHAAVELRRRAETAARLSAARRDQPRTRASAERADAEERYGPGRAAAPDRQDPRARMGICGRRRRGRLSALAVPVLDGDGTIVCALSMGGLTPQMARRGQPLHLRRLRSRPKPCGRG
jgi:DNA-binding IclR family transcriptional regulator